MWHYFVAHVVYYVTRCFPKDNRRAIRFFCLFASLVFLIPQFIVLRLDTSGRYCKNPLLNMLVASIGTTFAMLSVTAVKRWKKVEKRGIRDSGHVLHCFSFLIILYSFSFLFTMMEPVPWKLRFAFHFFGAFSCLIGILQFSYAVSSKLCEKTVPQLYYLSISFGIFGLVTAIFFACMLPFWAIEFFWQGRILNRKERRGICYEPVSNCPCLWRV